MKKPDNPIKYPALQWVFSAGLGEPNITNVTKQDYLSTIEFDKTGEFLSVGDNGGRLIVFKRSRQKKKSRVDEYEYFTEFQAHEPSFDYLKSIEIPERV
jgi:serine/threonine-protein phosphatase 2A regulatory subunit B